MHTDEYAISLYRELSMSRKRVERIRSALHAMEKRYGRSTEDFLCAPESGQPGESNSDFRAWREHAHALQRWEQRLREFEEIYRQLR